MTIHFHSMTPPYPLDKTKDNHLSSKQQKCSAGWLADFSDLFNQTNILDFEFNQWMSKSFDFSECSTCEIESFLINHFHLLQNPSNFYLQRQQLFLKFVAEVFHHGAWPWSILHGKTFLGHLQDFTSLAPPEFGIAERLNALGNEHIKLFEAVVCEAVRIECLMDPEKQKENYHALYQKIKPLQVAKFPGVIKFLNNLHEKDTTRYERFCNLKSEIENHHCFSDETLRKKLKDYLFFPRTLGYLNRFDDKRLISIYLSSISNKKWAHRGFKEICIEKALNIPEYHRGMNAVNSSEILAVAWNHYDIADCIFRDNRYFNIHQTSLINTIITKIIKTLCLYMMTSLEDTNELHIEDVDKLEPSTPLSLPLIKEKKRVFLPLRLPQHSLGLLIEPDKENVDETSQQATVKIFNTGWGIGSNHPVAKDGCKYQTCLRLKIPYKNLFNSNSWIQIRKLAKNGTPDQLYALFEQMKTKDQDPPSDHPLDFETPQLTGSCLFQHIQTFVRDEFMSCEHLGSKEMRYAAYRIVISDFMKFMGSHRFSDPADQQGELFEAWQEKKGKLEAILSLIQSYDPKQSSENVLDYFYKKFCLAKSNTPNSDKETVRLQQAVSKYWHNLHQHALTAIKKMSEEELLSDGVFNLRYSKFKKETYCEIKQLLKSNPVALKAFKQKGKEILRRE